MLGVQGPVPFGHNVRQVAGKTRDDNEGQEGLASQQRQA